MVIIAEDSRFRSHIGIDPAEIADALGVDGAQGFWSAVGAAWGHRDRLRGAQSCAKDNGAGRQVMVVNGDFSIESGIAGAARLLAQEIPPTAVFGGTAR